MKQTYIWLLVAALLAFLAPSSAMAEDATGFSSSVEVGAAGMSVDGEVNKVNEYNATRDDDGVNPYVKAHLSGGNEGTHVDVEAQVMGEDSMDVDLDVDASRIFRFDVKYDEFNHLLSHDQLDYMDATMKPQGAPGGNPAVYSEDLVPDQDFFIIHKELEMEGKVVIPDLPNVTLKAGFRQESREGVEQAIGISHCSACHVEGTAKNVDETTTDITLGATGKFGMLTVDYEYLTREFEDNTADLYRDWLVAGTPAAPFNNSATFRGRLLYDGYSGDEYIYSDTPESEKDSHSLKARYDMSNNTVISGGYIHADIESSKMDDVGLELSQNELSTDYDSYSVRASTQLGAWRVTGYGRHEELESSDNTLTFFDADGNLVTSRAYESEEAREITTLGGNAVYRLGKGSSLRLGYEYEEVDREIDEIVLDIWDLDTDSFDTREIGIDETITQTFKAAYRFRPAKGVNGRVSYKYQNIEDPFMHHFGNKGPISTDTWAGGVFSDGSDRWYGTSYYNLREAEATNQPEDVHELKASTTWTPGANYSVTAYMRYRMEESDLNFNTYEQDSFSPGVNVWWAPINDLNMTMAYNFNKMQTENQMCVGWYHG